MVSRRQILSRSTDDLLQTMNSGENGHNILISSSSENSNSNHTSLGKLMYEEENKSRRIMDDMGQGPGNRGPPRRGGGQMQMMQRGGGRGLPARRRTQDDLDLDDDDLIVEDEIIRRRIQNHPNQNQNQNPGNGRGGGRGRGGVDVGRRPFMANPGTGYDDEEYHDEDEEEVEIDEDIWFNKDKLLKDHIQEVLNKWDQIDDEIWAKVIVFERNRRVAKAYARAPVLTVNGSGEGFDGFRLGLNGFDNPLRDQKTTEILKHIGHGIKVKMDDSGNILIKRISRNSIYIRPCSTPTPNNTSNSRQGLIPPQPESKKKGQGKNKSPSTSAEELERQKHNREVLNGLYGENAVGDEILINGAPGGSGGNKNAFSSASNSIYMPSLDAEKPYKLFDMKKFGSNVSREIRRAYPDRRRLELQCATALIFVKQEKELLHCPCWILVLNLVAMDMLKSRIPPIITNRSLNNNSSSTEDDQLPNHYARAIIGSNQNQHKDFKDFYQTRPPLGSGNSSKLYADQSTSSSASSSDLNRLNPNFMGRKKQTPPLHAPPPPPVVPPSAHHRGQGQGHDIRNRPKIPLPHELDGPPSLLNKEDNPYSLVVDEANNQQAKVKGKSGPASFFSRDGVGKFNLINKMSSGNGKSNGGGFFKKNKSQNGSKESGENKIPPKLPPRTFLPQQQQQQHHQQQNSSEDSDSAMVSLMGPNIDMRKSRGMKNDNLEIPQPDYDEDAEDSDIPMNNNKIHPNSVAKNPKSDVKNFSRSARLSKLEKTIFNNNNQNQQPNQNNVANNNNNNNKMPSSNSYKRDDPYYCGLRARVCPPGVVNGRLPLEEQHYYGEELMEDEQIRRVRKSVPNHSSTPVNHQQPISSFNFGGQGHPVSWHNKKSDKNGGYEVLPIYDGDKGKNRRWGQKLKEKMTVPPPPPPQDSHHLHLSDDYDPEYDPETEPDTNFDDDTNFGDEDLSESIYAPIYGRLPLPMRNPNNFYYPTPNGNGINNNNNNNNNNDKTSTPANHKSSSNINNNKKKITYVGEWE